MHTCFDSIHIKPFVTQKKYEIAACIINAWGYICTWKSYRAMFFKWSLLIIIVRYVVLGPDEKDINKCFLSYKKSRELKFVLYVAVMFN